MPPAMPVRCSEIFLVYNQGVKSLTGPHVPTTESRQQVLTAAACGLTAEVIAKVMDISPKCLYSYYKEEIQNGRERAVMNVANSLYNQAVNDKNTTACIFWLKTRAQWRETTHVIHEIKDTTILDALVKFAPKYMSESQMQELLEDIHSDIRERDPAGEAQS